MSLASVLDHGSNGRVLVQVDSIMLLKHGGAIRKPTYQSKDGSVQGATRLSLKDGAGSIAYATVFGEEASAIFESDWSAIDRCYKDALSKLEMPNSTQNKSLLITCGCAKRFCMCSPTARLKWSWPLVRAGQKKSRS
jgi:hypothetical protein